MERYTPSAMERAMRVQEVILKAMSGELYWFEAAEILGVTCRTMRRVKLRYQKHGYDGLVVGWHHRGGEALVWAIEVIFWRVSKRTKRFVEQRTFDPLLVK